MLMLFINLSRTSECSFACLFHVMRKSVRLPSHVTSAATVLLGLLACLSLSLSLGREEVDLNPAVTRFLILIDPTREGMRTCNY